MEGLEMGKRELAGKEAMRCLCACSMEEGDQNGLLHVMHMSMKGGPILDAWV